MHRALFAAALCYLVFGGAALDARVTRIVIDHRDSPAYNGQTYGKAGQYELLSGHFYGELDPKDTRNALITDIQFAPRNARGMVDYVGTFAIAKPIDMSKANSVLFYSVPNRGNGAPAPLPDGQVSVVSGWQGDVVPRAGIQSITVPVAKNADGSPLTGPVFERFIDMEANASTLDIGYAHGADLPAAAHSRYREGVVTRRASPDAAPVAIASSDWAFADCTRTPFPGTPEPSKICVKGGFNSGLSNTN